MKRMIRITSLAIATLAISTAAMAQQGGGGGSGGGGGGGEGGGGDTSVIELRVQDHERVCTAVRKPSSGAPAFVPARAA